MTILLYHRVTELALDPNRLAVSSANFRDHMTLLRSEYKPLSLEQAAVALEGDRVPRRAVVVTFDDGYADNLEHAQPVLADTGVPATVFVATGYVDKTDEFWWDELERLVLLGGESQRELRLTRAGKARSWSMATPEQRLDTYHQLSRVLRFGTADELGYALQQLRRWAGEPAEGRQRSTHRPLTAAELVELRNGSAQVEVGAHTRWHMALRTQTDEIQLQETAGSRDDLEAWLNERADSFAFPFGEPGLDYKRKTVQLIREMGFRRAVSNLPAPATKRSPQLELPRNMVTNCGAEQLDRWLAARSAA